MTLRQPLLWGALLFATAVASALAGEGDPSKAGAYCKLPEPGEKPVCLKPAQARYSDFFDAVDDPGSLDEDALAGVESDLAASGDASMLALSSLAYGYWRLAMQVAETETVDPAIARQLDAWNQLLTSVYAANDADPALRDALQQAAADLEARTRSDSFRPADGLAKRLSSAGDQLGLQGAIRRVIEALAGDEEGS